MTPEEQVAKWQRHARDIGVVLPRKYWQLLLEHFRKTAESHPRKHSARQANTRPPISYRIEGG